MSKKLKGTIDTANKPYYCIKADNGDLYDFHSDEIYREDDRVIFDTINSPEADELAILGGPIPCENIRKT